LAFISFETSKKNGAVAPLFLFLKNQELIYRVLQGFSGFESWDFSRLNLNGFSGLRVSPGSCSAAPNREGPEANQRQRIAFL